jgi:hypothetical protein
MAIFADTGGLSQGSFAVHCRRGSAHHGAARNDISVTAQDGSLRVNTPYSANFVEELKLEIPATSRKWDPTSKAWLVSRQYSDVLKKLIDRNYSCDVIMPTVIAAASEVFETTFQADYVANCKNEAASVHSNGGWNAKIPEKVLRAWFKQADATAPATLYGVLGCDKSASDADIKKAYKRAARQWHPDVCREENAREMFLEVRNAYNILSSPDGRAKYNAGLMFEAMMKGGSGRTQNKYTTFTPMLRCGMLTVRAKRDLGVLVVEEILAWEDIVNETGQIMVSFWASDSWSMAWV